MVRQTSIEAYNKIKENGLLAKRTWEVYDTLFNFGPLTGREVFDRLGKKGFTTHTASRLSELRDRCAITEVGKKVCSVTGMKVILWDVTDRVPVKLDKHKTKCKACDGRGFLVETQTKFF